MTPQTKRPAVVLQTPDEPNPNLISEGSSMASLFLGGFALFCQSKIGGVK